MIFKRRTLKTVLGYGISLIEKYSGISFKKNKLTSIFNYLPINSSLSTSGQPTAQQLKSIQAAGFSTIINLAPAGDENALKNESTLVADLGMNYINIPVDFSNPTEQDFAQFVSQLKSQRNKKIWVHCAANMRVSCFIFKYRTAILGEHHHYADADLRKIWQPNTVWRQFIAKPVTQ
jgi:protein tyrosine phosphatase (PTP) superfamily phosphohydrolase (DUF442 family)